MVGLPSAEEQTGAWRGSRGELPTACGQVRGRGRRGDVCAAVRAATHPAGPTCMTGVRNIEPSGAPKTTTHAAVLQQCMTFGAKPTVRAGRWEAIG